MERVFHLQQDFESYSAFLKPIFIIQPYRRIAHAFFTHPTMAPKFVVVCNSFSLQLIK